MDNIKGALPQNGMGAPERRTQTLQNPRRRKRKKNTERRRITAGTF